MFINYLCCLYLVELSTGQYINRLQCIETKLAIPKYASTYYRRFMDCSVDIWTSQSRDDFISIVLENTVCVCVYVCVCVCVCVYVCVCVCVCCVCVCVCVCVCIVCACMCVCCVCW